MILASTGMEKAIKIDFIDFWNGFDKTNNLFYNLLSKHYKVEISTDPELVFYSSFGREYLKYDCIRIFYTPENERVDFSGCDYAMTFDWNNDPRHYRLPLYSIYYQGYLDGQGLKNLVEPPSRLEAAKIWKEKQKFCCIVVSNGKAKRRIDFFNKLSAYKQVDSGGRYLNTIGADIGPTVMDKLNFISQYRFVISFENSSYPGYTTEKILEPFFVNSIPIYWGNPLIGEDFNKNRFINYSDFKDEDDLIQFILAVDRDADLAMDILTEPVFPGNKEPVYQRDPGLFNFLRTIIDSKDSLKPVARSEKRILHFLHRQVRQVNRYSNILLGKSFR